MESKLKGMLGIAMRSGKLVLGNYAVKDGLNKGKIYQVIIGNGISDRSRKDAVNMCKYNMVEFFEPDYPDLIERATGKNDCYVVGIADANIAKAIRKIIKGEVSEVSD